ncbi:MAG: IPT/TIG domain-containing protein [Bryobacteraceae bacterium]
MTIPSPAVQAWCAVSSQNNTGKNACATFFCILVIFSSVALAQTREREPDEQQAERERWFYEQRAYPLGQIPTGARLKAIQALDQMDRARPKLRAATTDAANWVPIGPRPTDQGTAYVTAGRVNAIAIDPRDNNTVYIGAAEGGVWKTTDGGNTWTPLTDDQPSLANGSIALDPSNPDIVYAGTGEENFAGDSYYGAGILKSTDGGASWKNIVGPFLRAMIGTIAVHPTNGQIVLCTTASGVWRSIDGASNWSRVLGTAGSGFAAGTSLVFDPVTPNTVYAALGSTGGSSANGVYKSTDAGLTWKLSGGSGTNAIPSSNVGRIAMALAPSNPSTLYVAIQDSSTIANSGRGPLLGIWKSTDSGGTWNQLSNAPAAAFGDLLWYSNVLAVSPQDPDLLFAGALGIYRTRDGGATWQILPPTGPNNTQIHVDQHAFAFTPDGTRIYIGNDGGVYSTTNAGNTIVNWTTLNDQLAITQFYPGMSLDPLRPDFALGGTQDNGTQRYTGNPSWENIACGDGSWAAIDPAVPTNLYGACQKISINKTLDGGNTFFRSIYGLDQTDTTQFIAPLVLDPSNPQTLYFGTFRVWQTRDGAGRWVPISPDLTRGTGGSIKTIAIAPSDSKVLYAGASDGRIQVTENASEGTGATWSIRSTGLPRRAVTQIAVDPTDSATAYATFSGFSINGDGLGHVFRTTDRGASWTAINGNLPDIPANDIVVDPDVPDTLYLATDAGVMVTNSGGGTWSSVGSFLPRVVVSSLVLHRQSRILRAATHGRSVWDIAVPLQSASLHPALSAVSPATANAGAASLTITLTGSGFVPGAVARWNGTDRPTTFVDSTHLSAQIPASDVAAVGHATVSVFLASRGGGLSNPLNFSIGPAPVSKPEAFVSAANPTGGSALAPRSIATLFGINLAGGTSVSDVAPPLPFSLGGLSLNLGNTPVPLFFVSPGQVNFQVPLPSTITKPTPEPLVITQGTFSTTIMVTLVPFAPALFTSNSQGTGQASALIAGTASVAAPVGAFPGSRPARKGETISLYSTGLGDVKNRPLLGAPSPDSPLATTLTPATVTIGGVDAPVSFSGLAPGFVGLYQVNAKVPDAAAGGSAVKVVLTIGGVASNTATIALEP